ncbi:MAG: hypothetical protein J1F65_04335 [Clostridiales bacterium]|nr:hypothetical protein [Clostridiales bacterium]
MNKARLIATSGICGAIASVSLLVTSVFPYAVLIFAVMASVAVVVPLLIDGRNLVYSLLVYAVTVVVGALSGVFFQNVVYVAPVITFCIPMAIVKVYGETVKITAKLDRAETLDDPFEEGADSKILVSQLDGKQRLPKVVKWVLYYALLEVGVGLTLLVTYFITPPVFEALYSTGWLFWFMIGVAQLVVPLYDLLLHVCLIAAAKALRKVIK